MGTASSAPTATPSPQTPLLAGTPAPRVATTCRGRYAWVVTSLPGALVDGCLGAEARLPPGTARAPREAWEAECPGVPPGSHPVYFELNHQVWRV
jgi:hypothetical protein